MKIRSVIQRRSLALALNQWDRSIDFLNVFLLSRLQCSLTVTPPGQIRRTKESVPTNLTSAKLSEFRSLPVACLRVPKMSSITITETTSTVGLPAHTSTDPPPYTPPAHGLFAEGEEDENEDTQPTTHFVVNASTTIHGSGNIIAVPPPDVARLTAALVATAAQKTYPPRTFHIQLNCGVSIIGDRNVLGAPAIRPLAASQQRRTAAATAADADLRQRGANLAAAEGIVVPVRDGKRRAEEVRTQPAVEKTPHTTELMESEQEPEDMPSAKRTNGEDSTTVSDSSPSSSST